ncbi:MAG: hypothetical protein L3J35_06790 [Bacteroidales bacterium]|nr:hypothetical protein [Bacteroidales bacterium]
MNDLLEIAKYILPLIVLLIAVLLILKHFSDKEKNKNRFETIRSNNKLITPVRLQAYERIILLLERIKPDAMALRLQKPNITAIQMQILMLGTVRKEFNHNLSQQLYITDESWQTIVNAKEQVSRLVNLTATKMEKGAGAGDFTRALIETYNDFEKKPVEIAIEKLKNEALIFFGM